MSEGGSIPFLTFLKDEWPSAQFVVTGVLGPASNAHGPNEFLHLTYCKSLICTMAHVLANTVGKLWSRYLSKSIAFEEEKGIYV